jgi:hypothetical protein
MEMGMSEVQLEREMKKELEARQRQEQKLRQDKLDKERAQLILMTMRAELTAKFSR